MYPIRKNLSGVMPGRFVLEGDAGCFRALADACYALPPACLIFHESVMDEYEELWENFPTAVFAIVAFLLSFLYNAEKQSAWLRL